jgi:4-hydroxy-2-oxoheptanedioate aldolase
MPVASPSGDPRSGFWLTDALVPAAEIGAALGYGFVVLDVEHGAFDLAVLERFVPLLKGLGLDIFAKVLGANQQAIQQALDMGSDGVIVPHIESAAHAREVTKFSKFPPRGRRSFAGGRTAGYGGFDDDWVRRQDATTQCLPMVEEAGALEEIDEILALDTVDGVFIGPSDLSLSRGRGAYQRTPEDFDDITRVAKAAQRAGKSWMFPAWSDAEKDLAIGLNAPRVLLAMEHAALAEGFGSALNAMLARRDRL